MLCIRGILGKGTLCTYPFSRIPTQWEAEEENIAVQVAMGNALEELAASELSDPVEEVQFNGCYGVARPFVGVGFSDSQQQG